MIRDFDDTKMYLVIGSARYYSFATEGTFAFEGGRP